ncbi:MAG: DUF4287 domain-containing protein [Candidatus Cloacimonetes bacterium]|nr:DUF4287 domain-containing protein [Candidatus Cloacimonadota bacterium]
MNALDKALATQLANIETRSGRTLSQLHQLIQRSGLEKHGQIRDMLKSELGLGHGDANTLAHMALNSPERLVSVSAASAPSVEQDLEAVLDGLYSGPKSALRPLHEALMRQINQFGPFEIAPKKTYISLRRAKQFAMVGPATRTQVEVGLNCRTLSGGERLKVQKPGGMCSHTVRLSGPEDVDGELLGWIRQAFDTAG